MEKQTASNKMNNHLLEPAESDLNMQKMESTQILYVKATRSVCMCSKPCCSKNTDNSFNKLYPPSTVFKEFKIDDISILFNKFKEDSQTEENK